MKTSLHLKSPVQLAGLVLVLAAFQPALFAEEPAVAAAQAGDKAADRTADKIKDYRNDRSEMSKAEVKAAMAQIDAELQHLDKLADAAPTPGEKAEVKTRYDILSERRNELKKEFTRARYEAFKADLKAEMDKVSAWAKDTFTTKPAASAADNATSEKADDASKKINAYRADSSALNKADVKSALTYLDADIDLLAVKIGAVADPERKAELKRRLEAYKERRSELEHEFRQARYDALVADVKSEWRQLTD